MFTNTDPTLRVRFFTKTPVVGIKYRPQYVNVVNFRRVFDGTLRLVSPDEVDYDFRWFRVHSSSEEHQVGIGKTYVPTIYHLNCRLRLITNVRGTEMIDNQLSENVISFPPLPSRIMLSNPEAEEAQSSSSSGRPTFKVLSYNVLGDFFAMVSGLEQKLSDHPDWCHQWEYREFNLRREIIGYDADIICLQEVQIDHFEDFLKSSLENICYKVIFMEKKSQVQFLNLMVVI